MLALQNRIKTLVPGFVLAIMLIPVWMNAQTVYPQDYFRSPVDFRILLSGTFGELRAGHFHSGMDIKTGGVSGKKIHAVADGYVSRIKVSATGFGKTLYVTHANGYVSVYAHLSRFKKNIASYVKAKHYQYESYELNVYPKKGEFHVRKGEVIAYSGNTGGSNGPHLHFEMRLEATQTPVNPMLFGFEVKDYVRPEINWLKVYALDHGGRIDGKAGSKVFEIDGWGEQHRIKNNDTIHISGKFSLGLNAWDKLNDASNKNGVYSVEIYADSTLVYSHDLEKFDFSETRYINSFIDYHDYVDLKRRYQRTEIDPNNRLSIYELVQDHGILQFDEPGIHHLEYVVKDFQGNTSRLPIVIMYYDDVLHIKELPPPGAVQFSIDTNNEYLADNFEMSLAGSALYRDIWFVYDTLAGPEASFSRVHRIHNDRTALHKAYELKIVPDSLPPDTDKLLLARLTDEGAYIPYGGEFKDGALNASIRSFGDFVVLIDTLPPEISSVNIASGNIKSDRKTVKVKIKDDLSGIKKFRATLNASWLLMEYDAKNSLLTYNIDDRLKKGPNTFVIELTDQRDNKAIFEKTLIRE